MVDERNDPPTAEMIASCAQPRRGDGCAGGGYCLCSVNANARRRCIERGEGWRYGVSEGTL